MGVGFIGLGRMRQAMARNLLKAGFRVTVFNRTRCRAEELRSAGAEVADSPAGACKGGAVVTMLADDAAVEEVVLGSGRVIDAQERRHPPLDEYDHGRAFRKAD
jgi:3-hydroxyisobutyrate dehydrogenase-like beta-hydroxyacid dehydrogenase